MAHASQNFALERLSWSQDGQRIVDRLACGDYHDRVQTSERAAIGGNGQFGRKWDGPGQQRTASECSMRVGAAIGSHAYTAIHSF